MSKPNESCLLKIMYCWTKTLDLKSLSRSLASRKKCKTPITPYYVCLTETPSNGHRIQAGEVQDRKYWLVTGRDSGYFESNHQSFVIVLLEKVGVNLRVFVNFHFHLEGVELFLDLLGQHGRQAVAGSDLTPTVVLAARPGVVEHDPGAKGCVALMSLWSPWSTLSVLTEPQSRHKVVFIADSN